MWSDHSVQFPDNHDQYKAEKYGKKTNLVQSFHELNVTNKNLKVVQNKNAAFHFFKNVKKNLNKY